MEYEYGVEIGVWRVDQNRESKRLTFFKYGQRVGDAESDYILNHEELYEKLSEFAARYKTNKEE